MGRTKREVKPPADHLAGAGRPVGAVPGRPGGTRPARPQTHRPAGGPAAGSSITCGPGVRGTRLRKSSATTAARAAPFSAGSSGASSTGPGRCWSPCARTWARWTGGGRPPTPPWARPVLEGEVGPNPTDRAKNGAGRSLIVEGDGGPLGCVVAGANVHETERLPQIIEAMVVKRPKATAERPQPLCLDKGYDNPTGQTATEAAGYVPHIRRIGEEKMDARRRKRHPARRWWSSGRWRSQDLGPGGPGLFAWWDRVGRNRWRDSFANVRQKEARMERRREFPLPSPALEILEQRLLLSTGLEALAVPSGFEVWEEVSFVVERGPQAYSAYFVLNQAAENGEGSSELENDVVEGQQHNWLVLGEGSAIVEDAWTYNAIARAANAAYYMRSNSLLSSQKLEGYADDFDEALLCGTAQYWLKTFGYGAAKVLSSVVTGGAGIVKDTVKESMKAAATHILRQVVTKVVEDQQSADNAWRSVVREGLSSASTELRRLAGQALEPEYGGTISYQTIAGFYDEAISAISWGRGYYSALNLYLEQGLNDYIRNVIVGLDPSGVAEYVNNHFEEMLEDQLMAQSLGCLDYWAARYACKEEGLQLGADAVRTAFLEANRVLELEAQMDAGSYEGNAVGVLAAVLTDGAQEPVTEAMVNYKVRDSGGGVVLTGPCVDLGGGNYQATIQMADVGGAGDYVLEVFATKGGYSDALATTQFSVVHPLQVGHDMGVTGVAWDAGSAINPNSGDLHAMPGETIRIAGTLIRNFGDYAESGVPVYMSLTGPA